jgi:hypothetical protein
MDGGESSTGLQGGWGGVYWRERELCEPARGKGESGELYSPGKRPAGAILLLLQLKEASYRLWPLLYV